jgi:serine/threonine protein kinase
METRACAECGGSLPSGVSDVFCPACALRCALAGGKQPEEETWFPRWLHRLIARKLDDKSHEKPLANGESEGRQSLPMTAVAPAPGELIGDYEILERIGGNMGLVFKARHRRLDKVVALKLLPAADPERGGRFEREIRVMGQLEHPNLVTASDARVVGNWHLVVMELIDGVDLHQLVRTQGALPVAAACEAARQAASGLQYAHEHGLIHRDIKPSNLMLTRAGTIKVIDMGLALIREDSTAQLTESGLVLGTMSYCAPEQFLDASHVDIRADIYSLGCTLFHLLTGKSPYWQRKTLAEIMQAHLHEPFPSLAEALPDAPAGLETVLARMTAKDRDARFSTPSEVVEALEPFARGADLGPLVPAATQQSQARRPTEGKATLTPERQRGVSQVQRPKARWTRRAALIVLLPAITGGAFLFMNRRKLDPFVVLMDTTAEGGVYDTDNIGNGGSNAKEVAKVLQEQDLLPSRSLHQERIDLGWAREAYVLSLHPDLVIIHRSAFFHSINSILKLEKLTEEKKWQAVYDECDHKLRMLIVFIGTRELRTKFLVYSRGTDTKWLESGFQDQWKNTLVADFSELKDRIITMTILPGKNGSFASFRNSETGHELRSRVKDILGLP